MALEAQVEQGLKTAFKAYTDTLQPSDQPAYRCFFLDDEPEGETTEKREYPLITITASPNWPTQHQSTFRDTAVEIKWATDRNIDKKKQTLRGFYENCRAILDTETTITVEDNNLIAVIIEDGGESGVDENEQYIMLQCTVKTCGA